VIRDKEMMVGVTCQKFQSVSTASNGTKFSPLSIWSHVVIIHVYMYQTWGDIFLPRDHSR